MLLEKWVVLIETTDNGTTCESSLWKVKYPIQSFKRQITTPGLRIPVYLGIFQILPNASRGRLKITPFYKISIHCLCWSSWVFFFSKQRKYDIFKALCGVVLFTIFSKIFLTCSHQITHWTWTYPVPSSALLSLSVKISLSLFLLKKCKPSLKANF